MLNTETYKSMIGQCLYSVLYNLEISAGNILSFFVEF